MTSVIIEDRIQTTINTIQGIAKYSHTEIEDDDERWDDHWQTSNGEFVIHQGTKYHHVYLLLRNDNQSNHIID